MPNQLQRMLSRHHVMLEYFLQGLSNKDIARKMSITTACVSMCFNSPKMQDEISRRRAEMEKVANVAHGVGIADAQHVLETSAKDAAEKHVQLLECGDLAVEQRSANAILDRVGLSGRVENTQNHNVLIEVDTVNLLNVAMKESLAQTPQLENVS